MAWMWRNKAVTVAPTFRSGVNKSLYSIRASALLFLLFFLSVKSFAQDSIAVQDEDKTTLHAFDEKRWKSVTKDLDYTENIKKKEEKKPFEIPNFNVNPTVLKTVLIVLVLSALVFLLYKLFAGTKFISNKKVKEGDFSFLDAAEENLELADLESFLKDAIAKKQYKLAVRIYYLMTIKELMLREFIVWKKNKTNFEYITEMRDKKGFEHFHSLTKAFEIVWYGDVEIGESEYAVLSPSFSSFLNTVRTNGQK